MSILIKLDIDGRPGEIDTSTLGIMIRANISRVLHDFGAMTVYRSRRLLVPRLIHPKKSTGRMSRGIMYRVFSNGLKLTIFGNVFYTKFNERGTSRIKAKWFMRDALQSYKKEIKVAIKQAIKEAIQYQLRARGRY